MSNCYFVLASYDDICVFNYKSTEATSQQTNTQSHFLVCWALSVVTSLILTLWLWHLLQDIFLLLIYLDSDIELTPIYIHKIYSILIISLITSKPNFTIYFWFLIFLAFSSIFNR